MKIAKTDPVRVDIAKHVMQGLLACPTVDGSAEELAELAVINTDALIDELNRTLPDPAKVEGECAL